MKYEIRDLIKRHVCSLFRSWSKYLTDFVCFVIFNLLTVWFARKNSRRHSCIYIVYYYWHDSGLLKFTMDDPYNKWHSIVLQDLTQRLGFEPQPSPAIDSNLSFSSQITSHNQTHEEYFDHWPIFLTHAKNSLAHLTRDKTRCGRDSLFPLRNDNFCTMDEKKQVMENSLSSMIKRLINDDSSNSAQRHDLLSHFKFGFL